MTRVLLVDDDHNLRLALTKAFSRKGVDVIDLSSGEAALEPLKTGISAAGPVDVCVLDLRMPGMSGLEVLRQTMGRKVPVVVLTGHGTVPDAVEAMRLGAVNFVQKPVDADELIPILKQAERQEPKNVADAVLGASPVMIDVLHKLEKLSLADDNSTVLLVGETGTGKELLARRIHEKSHHKRSPFIAINAAAIPRDAFETELFGQRRGNDVRDGAVQRAQDGTLFLDEISDMPVDVQARLLRALVERKYRPAGSDVERPFRCRVIAATQRDLKPLVESGRFVAELHYQLSSMPLHLPPLRERGDDVILIARAWLGRAFSERPAGRDDVPLSFEPAAEEALRRHSWPGNVRELINIVKRLALFSAQNVIDEALVIDVLEDSPFAHADLQPLQSSPHSGGDGPRAGQRVTLEELEKTHIRRLLDELHNVSEVARIVGIDRRTLQRKMIAWGFRDARPADGSDEE